MSDTKRPARARRFGQNQLLPIVMAAMGGLFLWLGLSKYGFWSDTTGPLPGFFPSIIAAGLIAASVVAFAFSFKDKSPAWSKGPWIAVVSGILIIGSSYIIGLIPAIAVYLVVWLRWFEGYSWKTTLATFALMMAIVIGCFVLWLGVPFPKGLILDAILG